MEIREPSKPSNTLRFGLTEIGLNKVAVSENKILGSQNPIIRGLNPIKRGILREGKFSKYVSSQSFQPLFTVSPSIVQKIGTNQLTQADKGSIFLSL